MLVSAHFGTFGLDRKLIALFVYRKTMSVLGLIVMPSTRISTSSRIRLSLMSVAVPAFSACEQSSFVCVSPQLTVWFVRFAVRAGAKHVIGVDMSSIIEKAREIVAVNGMADKITLLQGKMEEVTLPFPQVDIIVSEWMGYFLLYESMLDTVLYARDRYLAPGGKIFPDQATIYVAGIEDGEYKDDKIGCKFMQHQRKMIILIVCHSLGQCLWVQLQSHEGCCLDRAPCRYC